MVRTYDFRVTTTGSAGSATGTAYIDGARGLVTRIRGNWHASAPGASSDVTIVETDDFGSKTLYAKTNSATDFDFPPTEEGKDNAGASRSPAVYFPPTVSGGRITVTVSQSDALTECLIGQITVME